MTDFWGLRHRVRDTSGGRRRGQELAGQRVGDEPAGLLDAVERHERAEARTPFLAEQDLIDGVEPGERNAGALRRGALGLQVLVAGNGAADVVKQRLYLIAGGAGGQRRQRLATTSPVRRVRHRRRRGIFSPASRNR